MSIQSQYLITRNDIYGNTNYYCGFGPNELPMFEHTTCNTLKFNSIRQAIYMCKQIESSSSSVFTFTILRVGSIAETLNQISNI